MLGFRFVIGLRASGSGCRLGSELRIVSGSGSGFGFEPRVLFKNLHPGKAVSTLN